MANLPDIGVKAKVAGGKRIKMTWKHYLEKENGILEWI
jgi:hypothetical protein